MRKKKLANRHESYSLCNSSAFATIEEKKESAIKLLSAVENQSERQNKHMKAKRLSMSTLKMIESVDFSSTGGNQNKDDKGRTQNKNKLNRPPVIKKLHINRITSGNKSVPNSSCNLMMYRKRPVSSSGHNTSTTMATSSRRRSLRRRLKAPTHSVPDL